MEKAKQMKRMILFLVAALSFGQGDPDRVIAVPQKYVSAEGIKHQEDAPEISKWAGIGKEIGIATKEGLNNAVEAADKFGTTRVGNFVLFMVAWKIIGREMIRYLIGLPMWGAGIFIWLWILRRLFLGYRSIDRIEGKTKIYKCAPAYEFESSDAKAGAGVAMIVSIVAWNIAVLSVVFGG